MKKLTLKCFEGFECTAHKCSDSCCIGWGIDIDEKTRDFYKNLKGDFGDFVKKNVDFDSSFIKMKNNGRCPFLNENNLCEIIINLGEEHISYICTHHPRFYNEFETHTEMGIGLCCEEGARLVSEEDVVFLHKIPDGSSLFDLRDFLFGIISKKEYSLSEKIYCFLDIICEAEELLFCSSDDRIKELINEYEIKKVKSETLDVSGILEIAKSTEPIDKIWEKMLVNVTLKEEKIRKNYKDVIKENSDRYNRLFYYYTFRYLLKNTEESDLVSKAKFIIYLLYLNIIFDTYSYLSKETTLNKNTVLISKQMEYSEDNLDLLEKEAFENEVFDFDNLVKV